MACHAMLKLLKPLKQHALLLAFHQLTHVWHCAVEWQESHDAHCKEIVSDISMDVELVVPRWFLVPKPIIRRTGNAVMSSILKIAVPRFLSQLEQDYQAWASGDESRQPITDSEAE